MAVATPSSTATPAWLRACCALGVVTSSVAAGYWLTHLYLRQRNAAVEAAAADKEAVKPLTIDESLLPPESMTLSEAAERMAQLKATGNDLIAKQKFPDALQAYQDALDLVAHHPWTREGKAQKNGSASIGPADEVALCEQRQLVMSNALLALHKLGYDEAVVVNAATLLRDNVGCARPMPSELEAKVRFRRHVSLEKLGRHDESLAELTAASTVTGGANETIENALARARLRPSAASY
jgi:hypothetical protein